LKKICAKTTGGRDRCEMLKYKGVHYCKCDCHRDGEHVMHFLPCCSLSGQKYITVDGKIDMIRLEKLVDEFLKSQKPKES
jgi:hypothetical protein